jgi:hypothetical protein
VVWKDEVLCPVVLFPDPPVLCGVVVVLPAAVGMLKTPTMPESMVAVMRNADFIVVVSL